jgi:hypothetical protein
LLNGRCRWHGGATPSGKEWHQPVFSDGATASGTSKLDRKLYDLDQARKRRAKVLKEMTSDERIAYAKWHAAREPRQSVRTARRRAREQDAEARAIFAIPELAQSPELMRLEDKIRDLEQQAQALRYRQKTPKPHDQPMNDKGIFG